MTRLISILLKTRQMNENSKKKQDIRKIEFFSYFGKKNIFHQQRHIYVQ